VTEPTGQEPAATEPTAGELADLELVAAREDALYAALASGDTGAFDDLFADDVTYIHSTGVAETKAENIAGQAHGVHRHGPTTTVSKRTRIIGDVAVTRGVIDMIDGTWRLLVRHATKIPVA
jgi:Domain of unknown function (DUF4440)